MHQKLEGRHGQPVWFDPESLSYGIGTDPRRQTNKGGIDTLVPRISEAFSQGAIHRLMVANTMQCNMTCSYCYNEFDLKEVRGSESAGQADPERQETQLLKAVREAPETGLAITFVGGEPLFDRRRLVRTVEKLHASASERNLPISFGIYTNGLLMTPRFIDWAHSLDASLVVSLDGPPLEHDRSRRTVGGSPTAQRILKNIRYLVESSENRPTRVRSVVQSGTDLLTLQRYLLALGFNEIHVQPAYGEDGTAHLNLDQHLRIMDWYTSRLLEGQVLDLAPYSGHMLRLARRGRAIQTHFPCDVGILSAALDPRGDFYPCHHFFGETPFMYRGTDSSGFPTAEQLAARARPVDQRATCKSCVARHMCGGECYHRASAAGAGYFGVLTAECDTRRQLLAPLLEMFDAVMRRAGDSMQRLVHGDLSPAPLDPEAYQCTSLEDFASIRGLS